MHDTCTVMTHENNKYKIEFFFKNKEKFKEQLKELNKNNNLENEFKLNSYQIYILGFITPIILFGIYYIVKKL
jgi:hypothetical protein